MTTRPSGGFGGKFVFACVRQGTGQLSYRFLTSRWQPANRPCAAPPYVAGVSLSTTLAPKVVGTKLCESR